jgi:hypothetical protein
MAVQKLRQLGDIHRDPPRFISLWLWGRLFFGSWVCLVSQ